MGLKDKTIQLLNDRRGDWPSIAKDCEVSYWWIQKLVQGHIADPGVTRIEKLHQYLTQSESAA